MIALLVAYVAIGLTLVIAARMLQRAAVWLAAVPMVATLAFLLGSWDDVRRSGAVTSSVGWVPSLDLSIDLRLDGLGVLMTVLLAGIGVAVVVYARGYFGATTDAARTLGLLTLFAGAMFGVVVADHVVALYGFWELTSITSWLLIGQRHGDPEARAAARHALLVTAAGGLCLLGGLVVLAQEAGTWSMAGILEARPTGTAVGVALGLVLVGIVTKSAQYPTHGWLPGAMVAPTPVSAYLHAATMVKAGIYLAFRLAPVFAATALWRPAVLGIGLFTMVAAGLRALRQQDLKLLLAMGTVSQLGLLLVLAGAGWTETTAAAAALLLAHGLFKAAAFLAVGIVDHQLGTRDRRSIDGLGHGWGVARVSAVTAAASMAGVAPLAGFIAKEKAYEALLHQDMVGAVVLIGVVLGSVLTFAYSARFAAVFLRSGHAGTAPAPSPGFVAPLAVLSGITVVAGLLPARVLGPVVDQAVAAAVPGADEVKLALWHGLNLALLLSVLTIAGGVALFLATERLIRGTQRLVPRWTAEAGFDAVLRAVQSSATAVTGAIQTGQLGRYAAVTLLVVVGGPAAVLIGSGAGDWPGGPALDPVAGVLLVAVVTAAVAAATVGRRFVAVLLLGAVGYATAALFALLGAPDLALTQFVIETLAIVAFMLVLRHLPSRFAREERLRGWRVLVATTVAAGVFLLASSANAPQPSVDASEAAVERSLPDAEGSNVVNVVLVDFRGLDTLGEITVLLVAAIGVTALARAGRRPRSLATSDAGGRP